MPNDILILFLLYRHRIARNRFAFIIARYISREIISVIRALNFPAITYYYVFLLFLHVSCSNSVNY